MTATDELRRLLDERGVEHGDVESAPYPPYNSTRRMTTFWANKCVWQYIEDEREGGDIELEGRYMSMSVTPEQAIAATLGRGTCHITPKFTCSECGHQYPTRNYESYETCDGRTAFAPLGHNVLDCKKPNFCPNCGRRVKGEGEC